MAAQGEIEAKMDAMNAAETTEATCCQSRGAQGQVVKLDRGYPLVFCADAPLGSSDAEQVDCLVDAALDAAAEEPMGSVFSGEGREEAHLGGMKGFLIRCEHATALVKGVRMRATIGDFVRIEVPEGHDKGIITDILPRTRAFVRKDPTERALPQVLAANFDCVIVAQPLADVNIRRMERELVLAHETGARVAVVLTKADLAESEDQVAEVRQQVADLVGPDVTVEVISADDVASVEGVRALVPPNTTAVLLGKSGVGKSSLVNVLVGHELQAVSAVRESDGKGRHTTVSRELISIPGGGFIVDMPGVRGLGLWDANAGIGAAFSDVEELAAQCRFRDCKHENEPGCAVRAAVESGDLAASRFESYQALRGEMADQEERREEARRMRGEKKTFGNHGRGKRKSGKKK